MGKNLKEQSLIDLLDPDISILKRIILRILTYFLISK